MNRWCSTNVSAKGPASSGWRQANTRSHGTNTSSKTVRVSSILCRLDNGNSKAFRSPAAYDETYSVRPGVAAGTANATA